MKKVIRTMAAAALLFATTSGMANEPKLDTDGISKSIIFEWEAQLLEASFKIVDSDGNLVYSDDIEAVDAYFKKFDLSPLSTGAYFVKIEDKGKELVYAISVNKNNISILGMKEIFKPTFRTKDGLLRLNFLNRDLKEVKVGVTDSFGRVLFAETVKDSFVVEKAFNFKDAFEGEYTVTLTDGDKTFYETYRVKK